MYDEQVVPGSYIQAGRQGSFRMGEVQAPLDLASNLEVLQSNSFRQCAACSAIVYELTAHPISQQKHDK